MIEVECISSLSVKTYILHVLHCYFEKTMKKIITLLRYIYIILATLFQVFWSDCQLVALIRAFVQTRSEKTSANIIFRADEKGEK